MHESAAHPDEQLNPDAFQQSPQLFTPVWCMCTSVSLTTRHQHCKGCPAAVE